MQDHSDERLPSSLQASRQKLPKDWRKKLAYIQAKVAEAAQLLPQEQRPSTSEGSPALSYLQVREKRDALVAGTSERSLFGSLTGPASVWDKLVRAYEKDSARLPHLHIEGACRKADLSR